MHLRARQLRTGVYPEPIEGTILGLPTFTAITGMSWVGECKRVCTQMCHDPTQDKYLLCQPQVRPGIIIPGKIWSVFFEGMWSHKIFKNYFDFFYL